MKKILKRVLIILVILLVVILLTAVIVAAFFQEAIGKKLVAEINKQLKTELKVRRFDLSLLRRFPDATASLQEVILMGTDGAPLLEAKEMAFYFRLTSLFGDNIKVHSLHISDGALSILTDRGGRSNYDIFKNTGKDTDADLKISLEIARLSDIEFIYRNEKLRQEIMMQLQKANFAGNFSTEQFRLKSHAELVSNFADLEGIRYFAGKKWGYDALLSIDLTRGMYQLDNARINILDNTYNLTGYVQSHKNFMDFDLKATAEEANLESAVALLPEQFLSTLGDFSSIGRFRFDASVKGKLSPYERPAIRFDFGLKNGQLNSPRLRSPFKEVSFDARFTNGERRSKQQTVFEITNFKGYLDRELITLEFRLENLDNPSVNFVLDGKLPLKHAYGLLNHPALTDAEGEITVQNLRLNGLYKDMTDIRRVDRVEMQGDVRLDDVNLYLNNGEKVFIDRGALLFRDNLLTLEDLKVEGAGSDALLSGSAKNLLPVLFADSLNTQQAVLEFQAQLSAGMLDVGRIVRMTDVPVAEGQVKQSVFDSLKTANIENRKRVTDLLKGSFQAKVEAFRYDKIDGRNFNGQFSVENGTLQILGDARAMGGIFRLDAAMLMEREPRLQARLDCEQINIRRFFEQTNNVGQSVLKAENISGIMNAKILIHAFWNHIGQFDKNQLKVWAAVALKDGELRNFKLLEEFSAFVKMEDLRNVRFVDLQNWVEVSNSTFYLPVMFMQSNAMNLTISGEQTFDDHIDYNIKINAGQVLAQRFKKQNSNLEPIPAKKNGFFNLYFNISGTLDKFRYETNKRKVKEKFERSESRKRQIKATLMRAFGGSIYLLQEPDIWRDEGENTPGDNEVEYMPGF